MFHNNNTSVMIYIITKMLSMDRLWFKVPHIIRNSLKLKQHNYLVRNIYHKQCADLVLREMHVDFLHLVNKMLVILQIVQSTSRIIDVFPKNEKFQTEKQNSLTFPERTKFPDIPESENLTGMKNVNTQAINKILTFMANFTKAFLYFQYKKMRS